MRIQQYFCIFFLSIILEVNGFYRKRSLRVTSLIDIIGDNDIKAKEHTFQQKQDHFDESNSVLWTQRFWSNDEFFKPDNSPIFLLVSGEDNAVPYMLQSGAWYPWAKKYNAMLYLLEHRFYGKSYPTPDASSENLKYLSSQQALEDIAYFIKEANSNNSYTSNNKWILFGGSYTGQLVAWARLHYPDIVHGAVSSSGALQVQADYPGYNENTRSAFELVYPGCSAPIAQAIRDVQEQMSTSDGADDVFDTFNICPVELTAWEDVAAVYIHLTGDLGETAQYNGQKGTPIHYVCTKYFMNETIGSPLMRYAQFINRHIKKGIIFCDHVSFDSNKNYTSQYQWDSPSVVAGNRQWDYQLCNEFGYYVTSETKDAFLSDTIPLKYYIKMCQDVFGEIFTEERLRKKVDEANARNQGRDIKVTNVIFLQGNLDPFHPLGELNNPTIDSPYILINGSSHCQDMNKDDDNDPPALRDARVQIEQFLGKILQA